MRFYGSTVLSYAVTFDLREFIIKMLETGGRKWVLRLLLRCCHALHATVRISHH